MSPTARIAVLATLLAAAIAPASAHAAADIEGVWSFTGGEVAVQPQTDGSFQGTVIRQTQFSTCVHAVGERMWTQLRLQADGQYWGKHQWFNSSTCEPLPTLGNSAWRVLKKPDGQTFLRACFAAPESPELQPTIDAEGNATNMSGSCNDSDLIAPPSTAKPTINTIATLPSQGKKKCMSKRSFRIKLKEPRGDALDTAKVYVNGKLVQTIKRDRITAPVNLVGLPKGKYTVKITAKTVLGKTISGTRKYKTCAKKQKRKNSSRV